MSEEFCLDDCPHYYEEFIKEINFSRSFRRHIYEKIELKKTKRILEVGSRIGIISQELREFSDAQITAIDSDHLMIAEAADRVKGVEFFRSNEDKLTMRDESFDVVFCHYFFMWKPKPFASLMEMIRVCKKDGYVVALAEPDYGGWMEHPNLGLGEFHKKAIQQRGGNPRVGRALQSIFTSAGLETTKFINSRIWNREELENNIANEWFNIHKENLITEDEYKSKVDEELKIIQDNMRTIALPIFTAIGKRVIIKENVIDPYDDL
ncbi:MAG: methyltransferase domain-containing protein [Candidatus Heimdallarchaeota archaeon]|nr:methyltransferase domain-containing protein [Candidatus Heimdallarchaeota archaeon]MCK4877805.1 methyltransferase domain-containing protein [Candidatus Heimdallarchaeota archaeon]